MSPVHAAHAAHAAHGYGLGGPNLGGDYPGSSYSYSNYCATTGYPATYPGHVASYSPQPCYSMPPPSHPHPGHPGHPHGVGSLDKDGVKSEG